MTRKAARVKMMDAVLCAGVRIGNVAAWCREHEVDRRTFYRHRQRVLAEGSWRPRSRRPRRSPGATGAGVAELIVRLRGELAPDNGADPIIARLREIAAAQDWAGQGLRVPHRSTVNKILKREGLAAAQPQKRPRRSWRRFAYARPRDCYQMDATELKLASGQAVAVVEVLDDCTRLLAACHAAPAETAGAAVAAITAAAAAAGPPAIVLCDNGAAFTGGPRAGPGRSAFARAVTALGARLIHSSPYHPQTCGKVERHHQTLKRWLALQPAPASITALQALLDAYQDHYNNRRYHSAIRTAPRHAWDRAPSHGGPGQLPRQDDATVHTLTVAANGNAGIGDGYVIHIGTAWARATITVIRDGDRVTAYTSTGQPIGHTQIDHAKRYQGQLRPAA